MSTTSNPVTIYADPKAMGLHTVKGDLIAIKVGERGYYPIMTKLSAGDMNAADVTAEIIDSAVGASCFGWDTPIARAALEYAARKQREA